MCLEGMVEHLRRAFFSRVIIVTDVEVFVLLGAGVSDRSFFASEVERF